MKICYKNIWKKASNNIKDEFDSEPVYNEKYLKTKIKSCKGKIVTNFHNKKISKSLKQIKTFIVNYFQKNVNMLFKKKKIPEYITDDSEISSFFRWF